MTEVILLGDPVVYRDDIKGFDDIGIVVDAGSSFKVLWNDDDQFKIEIYERLRLADLAEIDAGCRLKGERCET